MKKLIISMVATASIALVAKAEVLNSTSFEELALGAITEDNEGAFLNENGYIYWTGYSADSDLAVKELGAEGGLNAKPEGLARPLTGDDAKALAIDVDTPLARNIAPTVNGEGVPQDIDTGLYFDSMVQFTATTEPPQGSDGDKLIVWLKENEIEGEDSTYALWVTAGVWVEGGVQRKEFPITNITGIGQDEWHRLTIAANMSKNDIPTFTVYVDGEVATSTVEGNTVSGFQSMAYEQDYEDWNQITSVSFQVKGAIDELVWTTDNPIVAPTFAITAIANNADISFSSDEAGDVPLTESVIPVNTATVYAYVQPDVGYEVTAAKFNNIDLTVPAYDGTGYNFLLPIGTPSSGDTFEFVVTVSKIADEPETPVAKPFTVNGTAYETLAEAIDNANGATIMLTEKIEPTTSFVITTTVTIDLNGKTIKANDTDASTGGNGVFWVKEDGVLTLLDSSEAQTGTVDGNGGNGYKMAVWADGGKVVINGGTYVNFNDIPDPNNQYDLIYVKKGGSVEITGGTFKCQTPRWTLNSHNTSPGKFVVTGGRFLGYDPTNFDTDEAVTTWCSDDYVVTEDDEGYYTVVRGYAVTVEAANAEVSALADKYAEGATVTFTVTPVTGDYEVTSVTMNGTSLTADNGTYTFTMPAEAVRIVVTTEAKVVEPEYPTVDPNENETDDPVEYSEVAKEVIKNAFTTDETFAPPTKLAVVVNGETIKGYAAIQKINEVAEMFTGNPFTADGKLVVDFKVTEVMEVLKGAGNGFTLTVGTATLKDTYEVAPKYIDLATKAESFDPPADGGAVIFKLVIKQVAAQQN